MAKILDTPASDVQSQPDVAARPLTLAAPTTQFLKFRDKIYTSRTLIIPPSNRTLSVAKAQVEVAPADAEALAFLKASAEFEPLKE